MGGKPQGLGLMSSFLGIGFTKTHISWRWNLPNSWVMCNIGMFTKLCFPFLWPYPQLSSIYRWIWWNEASSYWGYGAPQMGCGPEAAKLLVDSGWLVLGFYEPICIESESRNPVLHRYKGTRRVLNTAQVHGYFGHSKSCVLNENRY